MPAIPLLTISASIAPSNTTKAIIDATVGLVIIPNSGNPKYVKIIVLPELLFHAQIIYSQNTTYLIPMYVIIAIMDN